MTPTMHADLTTISLSGIASLINAPNIVLLLIAIGFVCYTLLLLNTNKEMRRFSDWLNARADARDFMVQRYAYYREKRGIKQCPACNIPLRDDGACMKCGANVVA